MAVAVNNDIVDAGRRAPSTEIAMSDARNSINDNDEQKKDTHRQQFSVAKLGRFFGHPDSHGT